MEDTRKSQMGDLRPADLDSSFPVASVELPKLLLASASPRRAEILRIVGWPFETAAVDIDESVLPNESPSNYVDRLALAKAKAAAFVRPASLILAADTTVVVDEAILVKPRDDGDARMMLETLQGRWHTVITAIALISAKYSESRVAHESTEVKFGAMTENEIDWYVATGEPMDKAGAYAIQGIGARFIEGIKGDYFNVMGLPVRLLYKLVKY